MIAAEARSAVFIVDDDASIRDSVRSLLKSVGFHAEAFGSTEEFMKTKRADAPSCLVLDVRLPGKNGLDFQDEMERAGLQIPIIFITAHGDIPMTLRAMKAGAVEFLSKPFQKEDLLAAIEQALDRALTDDDPLPFALIVRRAGIRFVDRGASLFHLQHERIVARSDKKPDEAAGSDAADAHDLVGGIAQVEAVEE